MAGTFRHLFMTGNRFSRICLWMLCALSVFSGRAQTDVKNVMDVGRVALSYGDYVTALSLFSRVIEARPYHSDAYYYRAAAKFSLDDYDSSERDVTEAIRLNPFKGDYYGLRALCFIRSKKYEQAVNDYGKLLSEDPENQTARFNIAVCRFEERDYSKADSLLRDFLYKWPRYVRAYLLQAQVRLEQKDTASALQCMDSALVVQPTNAEVWDFKGRYALMRAQYASADSFLTKAISYNPTGVDTYMVRAQVRHALNRYSLALADYDKVLSMIPEHFIAHYNRGLLRSFVGDDNRAISDFDFVLRKEQGNVLARYNRALLRERVGDFLGAVQDYTVLLRVFPDFTAGYAARARNRRKIGDRRGALADESRVARSTFDFFFRARRKTMKKVRKSPEHALEQYDKLIEEDADTARTFFTEFSGKVQNRKVECRFLPPFRIVEVADSAQGYQSIIYVSSSGMLMRHGAAMGATEMPLIASDSLRKWLTPLSQEDKVILLVQRAAELSFDRAAEALQLTEQTIDLSPNTAYLYYNRGCYLGRKGRIEEARDAFSKAILLDDRMAEAFYNRGVAAMLLQEDAKAISDLSRAGELGLYRAYNLLKQAKKALK